MEVTGRFAEASNATLLAETSDAEMVVYKPRAGERPLWDFSPETLAAREVLTYEVSGAMGLAVVPQTVLGDGPYGPGSVQRFVEATPTFDPVAAVRKRDLRLWPLAVLDVVTNNADRKLGHILEVDQVLLGIDHGLTFHPEPKLRTVLWLFAGNPIPRELLDAVSRLETAVAGSLGDRIEVLLGREERNALAQRTTSLLMARTHPLPPIDRPPVPWPAY